MRTTNFFRAAVFLFGVFCAAPCPAKEILAGSFGYYVDIPEDWQILEASNPALVSFTDPGRRAVFQITVFPAEAYASAREVQAYYKKHIKARGEEADFVYQGAGAVIGDYRFDPGAYSVRGWFIFLSTAKNHFALSAFCEASAFEASNDVLLSCLDSFAPGEEERLFPGPVSQFYHAFQPGKGGSPVQLHFGEDSFSFAFSPEEVEANTVVIERESRLLAAAAGGENQNAAWRRYYRVIFRDSYMRLLPAAQGLEPLLQKNTRGQALPAGLLAWFQGFSYSRTDDFTDFQSPLDCVVSSSGDCDSLGLAYIILLRHLGFEAILLVSEKYSHALAAVDVPGEGARFDFEGKRYLVAELTKKVAIGRIAKDMADPAFWLPVALGRAAKKQGRP